MFMFFCGCDKYRKCRLIFFFCFKFRLIKDFKDNKYRVVRLEVYIIEFIFYNRVMLVDVINRVIDI